MNEFTYESLNIEKNNRFIDAVLYNDNKIKSFINYIILLRDIRKSSPSYSNLLEIYDFIIFLNFTYFHCLNDSNHLFIAESRKGKDKNQEKSLIYKDENVKMILKLKPKNIITLHISRNMGYTDTSITFEDGNAELTSKIQEQLFINCTNLIMNELYRMVKKYRKYGRSI